MEKEAHRSAQNISEHAFFKILSNLAPIGIFFTDPEGKCTYVNKKWMDIAGISFEDALGEGWAKSIHPDDKQRVVQEWLSAMKENRPFKLEYRFSTPSGEVTWVLGQAEALFDKNQRMIGYVGTLSEISDRVQAQEEARENEQRFTNAFEHAAIGMALVSPDGKWLKVNNSTCNLLGYSKLELMGLRFQDVTHPDDLNKDLDYVKRMLSGEIDTYEMEKRYFHKSGQIIWVRLSVSMVRDHFNEPLYFISQIEDITDRKMMEEKLLENQKRLQLATKSAGLGIWDVDLDDKTLRWDEQMFRLYGLKNHSPEVELGTWMNFIHPDDREYVFDEYLESIRGTRNFNAEFRVVWPNGSVKTLRGMALVLRDKGRAARIIGVNLDVTEDKNAIERLRELNASLDNARKTAEEATNMKSRFLDIAAHELRTPVTALSLLLQLTQRKFEKNIPVNIETLSRLRIQCDRISRLVIDLLDVSRLERGVLLMDFEKRDIVSLISECVNDIQLHYPGRQINFIKPSESLEIEIDPIRIYQVLSNLLNNAIKYTPERTPIEITVIKEMKSIKVSVIDHGRGIPENQQSNLFTIFSRGPTELTERSGGLGLGLFISRSIVELHGGKINFKSTSGEGSTFTFELPLESRRNDHQ